MLKLIHIQQTNQNISILVGKKPKAFWYWHSTGWQYDGNKSHCPFGSCSDSNLKITSTNHYAVCSCYETPDGQL